MKIKIPREWVNENFKNRIIYKKIGDSSYEQIKDIFQIEQNQNYYLVLNRDENQAKIFYEYEKGFRLLAFFIIFMISSVNLMSMIYQTNEWSFYPEESFITLTLINSYLLYSIWIKDKSSLKFNRILRKNLKI